MSYWIGPYGLRVPNELLYVEAEGGGNRLSRDGAKTEMRFNIKLTKEEYMKRHAYIGPDGFYWYRHFMHPEKKESRKD